MPFGLISLSIGGSPLETFIDESALRRSNLVNSENLPASTFRMKVR